MFEPLVREGVCRCRRPGARWLATGPAGGLSTADAAFNVTVPEGFDRTDLAEYAAQRRAAAGFGSGPTLLTGVDVAHARVASAGPVRAVATAGLSNPAVLAGVGGDGTDASAASDRSDGDPAAPDWRPGTVNLVVGVERALRGGGLAELLATCVEAKTATLERVAGVSGTTSDAAVVGAVPEAAPADFAGSATPVGSAARACVRDAVVASLHARYPDGDWPRGPAAAEHGVRTDRQTEVAPVPREGHE